MQIVKWVQNKCKAAALSISSECPLYNMTLTLPIHRSQLNFGCMCMKVKSDRVAVNIVQLLSLLDLSASPALDQHYNYCAVEIAFNTTVEGYHLEHEDSPLHQLRQLLM